MYKLLSHCLAGVQLGRHGLDEVLQCTGLACLGAFYVSQRRPRGIEIGQTDFAPILVAKELFDNTLTWIGSLSSHPDFDGCRRCVHRCGGLRWIRQPDGNPEHDQPSQY